MKTAIATPSLANRQQSASQPTQKSKSAKQVAASRAEAAPPLAYVGFPAAAMSSTASGTGRGERLSILNQTPFPWTIATAAEISRHCRLGALPLGLIDQVLPKLRSFLDPSFSATADACNPDPAQAPAPAVPSVALALHGYPWPQSVDGSGLLSSSQPLASFSVPEMTPSMEQPEMEVYTGVQTSAPTGAIPDLGSAMDISGWWNTMDDFAWAPPTEEELTALRQEQGGAALYQTTEEAPSAGLEYLLGLEHDQAMEAGWGEHPFILPTCEDAEQSSWGGPPL